MTGFNRCVSSEDQTRRGQFPRLGKREPTYLHQPAYPLQCKKCGVPFVHVKDRRCQIQGFESTIASDPKKNLLLQPCLLVAAIQLICNGTIFRAFIGCDVGVEQVERDTPDLGSPYLSEYFSFSVGNFDGDRLA